MKALTGILLLLGVLSLPSLGCANMAASSDESSGSDIPQDAGGAATPVIMEEEPDCE